MVRAGQTLLEYHFWIRGVSGLSFKEVIEFGLQ